MVMVVFAVSASAGKINSTVPSSEIILPPGAPSSLLTEFPSGVTNSSRIRQFNVNYIY